MNKVNFFIIGCPRCGTTSLYHWLKQHPQIFMSDDKEPEYYSQDILPNKKSFNNEDEYLSLFNDVTTEKVIGEASTYYIFSDYALKNLPRDAKLLVSFRNPIDFLFSLHNTQFYGGKERIRDFKKAINEPREENIDTNYKWILRKCYENLEKYKEKFGENLLIITLDDMRFRTEETFKKILDFLKVDTDFQPEFRRYNAYSERNIYITKLNYLIRNSFLKPIIRTMTSKSMRDKVMKSFTKEVNKKETDQEFLRELERVFKREINTYQRLKI